jgi:C-terminal processing protease CtpA/Prc
VPPARRATGNQECVPTSALRQRHIGADSGTGGPAMAQKTPRGGLRGVGMVLQARDARDARGAASFFALRPQEFVVKELLSGGPAADCRTISCGDCIAEIDGTRVEGRTLQQVRALLRPRPARKTPACR